MLPPRPAPNLDRFFRGLAEHAFHGRLGVVDPPLVDYVSSLLLRFIRSEHLMALPGGDAGGGDELVLMLAGLPQPAADRGGTAGAAHPAAMLDDLRSPVGRGFAFRHIGDYTLFWTGLYPEALRRRSRTARGVSLDEYRVAGKRAYWIASTCGADSREERSLLERLSRDYDTCAAGLAEVRRAWGEP